jgi:hypothetical protein
MDNDALFRRAKPKIRPETHFLFRPVSIRQSHNSAFLPLIFPLIFSLEEEGNLAKNLFLPLNFCLFSSP